jgi:hypothetical protein
LDIMEERYDWAKFHMTPEHFKFVFTQLIPDVLFHTREQDETQIRDNYDREWLPRSDRRSTFRLTHLKPSQVATISTNGIVPCGVDSRRANLTTLPTGSSVHG